MRIFDKTKTIEIFSYDENKGYLIDGQRFIAHHDATSRVEERGHYETVNVYPNGGKDVKWVVDVEGAEARDAWDEYEDILVFVEYTAKELAEIEISKLKAKLAETDYQAIKFAEGVLSEAEYAPMRTQRQYWRDRINDLEQSF